MKIIYHLLLGLALVGLMVLAMSGIFLSEEQKNERVIKDNFESCMKDVAEEYCINQSMEYNWVDFSGVMYREDFPDFLDYPYKFKCNFKRVYNEMSYFKFTKEEIFSCVDEFVNSGDEEKNE